ncbi:hemerythrin domain-containing protein [Blastococcus sp. CT_GayMR16]|uniref:hemerythrin domain-containing protein n=1 Tax=Blastococcus sp. CT_GayMR16 TaxID=2559607 RepID=UPI001074206A|nr:hemerythrin domain-containing protein [Blastococcus sp. CT_GayMR16]TFV87205.1 hemerythrin domain-containing protein [Blastococcus sp. CT_GayMR16]
MTTTSPAPRPAFAVTPRRAGEPEADLLSFTLIHRALRSGTRQLADAAGGIAAGQPCSRERQRALVQMALAVLHEITTHHEREDDVLWPVIVASVEGAEATTVELADLSEDHVELHAVIGRAQRALPAFAREPRTGAAELGAVLTEMADLLDEHIGEEEREVFPVIREHVSAADFARCEELFRKGTSIGQLTFLLPWVADQCTPEERAELLASAGRPLVLLLRLTEGRYVRRRDLVRG